MQINDFESIYYIGKDFHRNEIEQIPSEAELSNFFSIQMKLAWLAKTTPDIVFEISQITHVARSKYEKDIIKNCKRFN